MDHDDVGEQQEPVAPGDADLVLRTRCGDRGAFGELWRRHYRAGVTVARNMTSSLDPDDLVQEAYTRIYQSIVAGGGPTGSFRAYLFTSIRNTAAAWGRARRETAYDELDGVEDPAAGEHASEAALDRGLTHRAFRSLPTRWQEVLWYSEIEQMKPAEIAPLLGMKATAVAQLTFRAREGLRGAWIQAHLQSVEDGSDCQWAIERLGAYSRRNLGRRDHAKVDAHLAACVRCSIVASEAKEVSSRLALVLLPLALGAAGTAGYLATVQGGSAPLVALAAMPQAIVQGGGAAALPAGVTGGAAGGGAAGGGAVVGTGAAAGTGAAGAAAGVGTGAAAGAGCAGAGAAAISTVAAGGTALAGIGAASGLVAASLVVVGGVVAAAVALPPVASDPVPAPSSISDVAPATPPLAPETDADTALRLPAPSGPGPADLPAAPDGDAGAGGTTTTTGTGGATDGAAADAGTTPSGGGQANAGGQGNGSGGGQGNAGGQGDSTAGGSDGKDKSNGNAGSGSNGNADDKDDTGNSGNGTPTNGTGGGNGGTTGNGGSTGNGTPTNGTGNGNGGNTGVGNGAANGSTDNNGNGKAKGAVNAPQSLGVTPTTTDPSEIATPDEATNGGKRTGQVRAQSGPQA